MSENEMLVGRALKESDGRKWCGNWDGKGGSHLRGRDRLLEVQENKPETGLLPTKVLHSERHLDFNFRREYSEERYAEME